MGSKYNYHACFLKHDVFILYDLLMPEVGVNFLRRFGSPKTLSVQNYEDRSSKDFDFNKDNFSKLLPPKKNELVTVYPATIGNWSMMISNENSFLVATISIESKLLSRAEIPIVFNELKAALLTHELIALISGEELEVDEAYINNLKRNPSSKPKGINFEVF
jgi:hypothetical protein